MDEGFDELGTACVVGTGACQQAGVRICSTDGQRVVCDAQANPAFEEICDRLDNDCDGVVDNGFDHLNTPCTVGTGACANNGVRTCSEDGAQVICSVEPSAPTDEICDRLDNDCDGVIDNGFDRLDSLCTVGIGACANTGLHICSNDGAQVICSIEPGQATDEICDRLDNDCDGVVDNGFDRLDTLCTVGTGTCASTGVHICSEDGAQVICGAEPGPPADEICDGLDNDCDGAIDNGFDGLNRPCFAGDGACQRAGVQICAVDGSGIVCDAEAGEPAAEQCDGLDNDCDGETDNGFDGLGLPCSAGIGICEQPGVMVCRDDGLAVICNAEPVEPQAEICDGLDNDCDGGVDEGFAGLGIPCTEGQGICQRSGVGVCAPGGDTVVCDAVPGPVADEICDRLDNDCNGEIDEGFEGIGQPCTEGQGACQRTGVGTCAEDGSAVICDVEPGLPAEEICDHIDNDCDGVIDNGFHFLNVPCAEGIGACARMGVTICGPDGADVVCSAKPAAPAPEICDGLDNDCDGTVDDGFDGLDTNCVVGVGACQRAGVRVCAVDGSEVGCNVEPGLPVEEQCDGVDNDCDEQIDEDWINLGDSCTAGFGLCRRSGIFVCDGIEPTSAPICNAEIIEGAAAETCDFQDDDCDGQIDEGFVDDSGRYVTLEHCGACGTDCRALWDPSPEAYGVVPRCGVDTGVAQCDFDCLPGFHDADGVVHNGCEFVVDADAIYVATEANGGDDEGDCGAIAEPCETIGRGIGRAVAKGATRVRVSEGVYRETISLADGVSVLGGHHRTSWVRDPELNVTFLNGRDLAGDTHRRTVRAVGIVREETVLDGFVINTESPLSDGNSYGIYIRDCNAQLSITHNRIFAGNGGGGSSGDGGARGAPGDPGGPGLAASGHNFLCGEEPIAIHHLGGGGGASHCDENLSGGQGGSNRCPSLNVQEGTGEPGWGLAGGTAGSGAWGMYAVVQLDINGRVATAACETGGNAFYGTPGGAGSDGADGIGGAGAVVGMGSVSQGEWQGNPGQPGQPGGHGSGGGGGGAAAGVDLIEYPPAADIGASGGGGGGGGCRGTEGLGGHPGGGSFAIFVSFTAPGPGGPGDLPIVRDNLVSRGLGGPGGSGGNGGGGGSGGSAGAGGPAGGFDEVFVQDCSIPGALGGRGGRGGHGGGGGGGQGGASFGIILHNDNGIASGYDLDNDFTTADDENTAGPGGVGGDSSNPDTGLGVSGEQGPFGNFGRL